MERRYAHNGKQVAAYATDLRPHGVEQMAELLYVRLASSIVDGGGTFSQYRSHDDVGRTRNGSLIEEHVTALQFAGLYLVHITLVIVYKLGTQVLESQEMGIEPASAYLVAAGFGNGSLSAPAEQRPNHQHAASER